MDDHSVKTVSILSSKFKTWPINCTLPRPWLHPAFRELAWKFRSWEIATPGGKLYWSIALWLLYWGASWCWHGLLNFCEQYIHKMVGLWINQEDSAGRVEFWTESTVQMVKKWKFPCERLLFSCFFHSRFFFLRMSNELFEMDVPIQLSTATKTQDCVDSSDWRRLKHARPGLWEMLNSLAFKN